MNVILILPAVVACAAGARWWMLQCARAARFEARWPHGTGRAALRHWIEANMPELDAELGPLGMDQVRERLNALTGCNVQGSDSIERGSVVFLAALQAQHANKETPP